MILNKNLFLCICSMIIVLTLTVSHVYAGNYVVEPGAETSTASCNALDQLDLGDQTIINSALYNNEADTVIAILTHTQAGTTAILLATFSDKGITLHGSTILQSLAHKVEWVATPDNSPYIVTDEYDRIALYKVDLIDYKITLVSWTPNLAAGTPSTFLHCLNQHNEFYVIQGFNETDIATYNLIFEPPLITPGVATHLNSSFSNITACSACRNYVLLGGTNNSAQSLLARYTVNSNGHLRILARRIIQ